MAADNAAADKYRHHIMLRYFQLLPKDHPAVQKYLAMMPKWKIDHGHPWEMIEFYRALLVSDDALRIKCFESAAQIAEDGGPTLHVIAAAILGSWYYYDRNLKQRFENMAGKTIQSLPDLGEARISALYKQLNNPLPPQEFIKKVLPFNFR